MKNKMLSFENVKRILDSQKILICSQIDCTMEVRLEKDTETSFYSPNQNYISICYPQIVKLFKNFVKQNKIIDHQDLIRFIRTLLFHEFGHAMFTDITHIPDKKNPLTFAIFNVLEDERIEMNMEKYFTNIDFKEVLSLLCPVEKTDTSIRYNQFYNLVRHGEFQKLPEDDYKLQKIKAKVLDYYKWFVNKPDFINNIDKELISYNQIIDQFLIDNIDSYLSFYYISTYILDIYFEPKDQINTNNNPEFLDLPNLNNEELEAIVNTVEALISNEMSDEEIEDYLEELQATFSVSPYEDKGELSERFEKKTNAIEVNSKLEKDLIYIFESVNRQDKMNSAALNSYSGRFDPRSVIRNDYKYFLKSGNGNQKGTSKLHLNLIIDRSGSMYENESKIRSLIKTVDKVCKKIDKLSYTLLSIGSDLRIEDPRSYVYKANGGNAFKSNMTNIMKSVQQKDAINYNLVLFDGEACWHSEASYGSAFNGSNFCIISDPENRNWLKSYCQESRVVITEDYYNTFEKEIIKSLAAIVK